MKEITIDKLIFKNHLSMIEQYSLKDFMFKWLGSPDEGLDDFLPLKYTDEVFAKMETTLETKIKIHDDETFRYVTITEDNQIVIGGLDSNQELKFRILSLEERLKSY
ncbi:hypothetical protein QUF94_13640 [Peribacillus sp. NJ4]|uniref:hypothetical protein n=1 Tax=Peribacillus TaxID=2675229 RepID=UPI0025A247C6|nr:MULTISPECIES: hypothetical protein [unclassified Peribacillus]MDM5212475.1 hypothetical protein [Peribacillus sp. NJ4]MDM5222840.1 hypothetical protein [Peribacillus sp. NJ11]